MGPGNRSTNLRRQGGAETVEFALTFVVFMFVFFMIVDIAIATFNRGVVLHAAREASRQGSLYWVDPATYDDTAPEQNQRLKRAMISTMEDWYEDILVDAESAGIDLTVEVDGNEMTDAIMVVNHDTNVAVDMGYDHAYIGMPWFTSTSGFRLDVASQNGVE